MENSIWADPARKPSLNPKFYDLQGDNLLFFKEKTGIQDDEELKRHILDVQAQAYEIFGYPCIRLLTFLKAGICLLPGYQHALSLPKKYPDAIFLDLGCCFGVDVRKIVSDGWPADRVVASDIQKGFWDFGHRLFKSNSESFPAGFVAGDIFDSSLLNLAKKDIGSDPVPPLKELTSLSPLLHKVSAIHISSVFHLFSEERQRELAKRLLALLKIQPGSIIFGMHCGRYEAGIWQEVEGASNFNMFCHSPDSWKLLWAEIFEDAGLGKERVEVDASIREITTPNPMDSKDSAAPLTWTMLVWSVKVIGE